MTTGIGPYVVPNAIDTDPAPTILETEIVVAETMVDIGNIRTGAGAGLYELTILANDDATVLLKVKADGTLVAGGPVQMKSYTTTERDALTATDGMIILNTTLGVFQGRAAGAWVNL